MSQGLERGTESHRACVVSETALCFVSLEPDGFTQPCGSPQVTSTLGRPVCRSAVGPFVLACTPTVDLCPEQRQSSPPSSPASGRDRLCPPEGQVSDRTLEWRAFRGRPPAWREQMQSALRGKGSRRPVPGLRLRSQSPGAQWSCSRLTAVGWSLGYSVRCRSHSH